MKKTSFPLIAIALTATISIAADKHGDQEVKEDIARHRAMAAAHEAAAKCLEGGRAEDICNRELEKACKGIAIGKFCGLKHQH